MASVKHYLQFSDFSQEEYHYLFQRAQILKRRQVSGESYQPLTGKVMSMVFEKHSTRTRASFEAGFAHLGGHAIFLDSVATQLGRGETIEDTARALARYSDILMVRTHEHARIECFAAHSQKPVINGLTNEHHPCQVFADILTYIEHRGPIAGKTVAWIGDSNNVCRSWLQAADRLNFTLRIATPAGYELKLDAKPYSSNTLIISHDPKSVVRDADIVTTDAFTSMGFESQKHQRLHDFAHYQVTPALMQLAKSNALFMHCLPAHRGEEVAAEVIDGPQSVVWDEAENRLHVQKALIEYLVRGYVHDET